MSLLNEKNGAVASLETQNKTYPIEKGFNIVGSEKTNEKFTNIIIKETNISSRHTIIKYTNKSDIQIIDLCTDAGTSVGTDKLLPLIWHQLKDGNIILIGSLKCHFKVSSNDDDSGLCHNNYSLEDTTDTIACSPEVAQTSKTRRFKRGKTSSKDESTKTDSDNDEDDFCIPSTQQESFKFGVPKKINKTDDMDLNDTVFSDDTEEGYFYIPETQENKTVEKSQVIPLIGNTAATDDEIIQFGTEDEDTCDGTFNNPYAEASQNLLQELETSFQRNTKRESIIPDKSVDTISFRIELSDCDEEELSKIEWNETKNLSKNNSHRNTSACISNDEKSKLLNVQTNDDPSKSGSVTPEIDFDKLENEALSSLQRDNKVSAREEYDANDTQMVSPNPVAKASTSITPEPVAEADIYEMDTQLLHNSRLNLEEDDPYDVATQLFEVPKADKIEFAKPSGFLNKSKAKIVSEKPSTSKPYEENIYDVLTQPLPKSSAKVRLNNFYDLETQPLNKSMNLKEKDSESDEEIATQRAPKFSAASKSNKKEVQLMNCVVKLKHVRKDSKTNKVVKDVYDLETQQLVNDFPCVTTRKFPENEDVYDLPTQPFQHKTISEDVGQEGDNNETLLIFRPPVNSTRNSGNFKGISDNDNEDLTQLIVSPSNKENFTSLFKENNLSKPGKTYSRKSSDAITTKATVPHKAYDDSDILSLENTDEELDEELCMAETIPINEKDASNTSLKNPAKTREKKVKEGELFKEPNLIGESISSTPKPGSSFRSMEAEMNTPVHPLLSIPSKKKIILAAEAIRNRSNMMKSEKNKYIFGDSSDDSDDEPLFPKSGYDLEIMEFDKKVTPILPIRKTRRVRQSSKKFADNASEADIRLALGKITPTKSPASESKKSKNLAEVPSTSRKEKKISLAHKEEAQKKQNDETEMPSNSSTKRKHEASPSEEKSSAKSKSKDSKDNQPKKVFKEPLPIKQSKKNKTVSAPRPEEAEQKPQTKRSQRNIEKAKIANAVILLSDSDESETESIPTKTKLNGKSTHKTSSNESTNYDESYADRNTKRVFTKRKLNADSTSNESTSSTESSPRKSTRVLRPKIMFTKVSPTPYTRMITRNGGQLVDSPEAATILISDHVYRTYKFLCAIAKGIPIVGVDYLNVVQSGKNFVDPSQYILSDLVAEKRFKFNLKKSLNMAQDSPLFQDYSVFITPNTKPPPNELQFIVGCAGGKTLKQSQLPKSKDKMFVISDTQDQSMWEKLKKDHAGIQIISTEGFMLSIMQHYINFKGYLLG